MAKVSQLVNPTRIDFPNIDNVLERLHTPTRLEQATFPVRALFHQATQLFVRNSAAVHYGSDNGNYADLAAGEIKVALTDIPQILRTLTGRPTVQTLYHDVPSMDPNAAAFDLAQLSRGALRGFGNVFFFNCAPRKKQRGVEGKNGGESIYLGILPNGAIIGGTGEDLFTHFKDLIEQKQLNIYRTNVATNGTQFRSRDYFPWLAQVAGLYVSQPSVARKWNNDLSLEQRDKILFGLGVVDRDSKLELNDIPDLANNGATVVRADTHGNLKLGVRFDQVADVLKDDPKVVAYANGHVLKAQLKTASFDASEGNTAISGGSSGRWTKDGKAHRYNTELLPPNAEIFTVGERARDHLGISEIDLRNGVDVHIIPESLFAQAKDALVALTEHQHADAVIARAIVRANLVKGLDAAPLRQSLAEGNTVARISPIVAEIESQAVQLPTRAHVAGSVRQDAHAVRGGSVRPT